MHAFRRSLARLSAAALWLVHAPTAAAGTISVEVAPEAQEVVSAGELQAATLPRLARSMTRSTEAVAVTVERAGEDRLRIRAGARTGDVVVGARRGLEAARLAAVLLVDLVEKEAPVLAQAVAAPAASHVQLGAAVAWAPLVGPSPSLLLGWHHGSGLGLRFEGAYGRARAGLDRESITLQTFPLRLGLAYTGPQLDAMVGPIARPFRSRGVEQSRAGLLWGAGATLGWTLATLGSWSTTLRGGVDVTAERLELRLRRRTLLRTDLVTPWVGLSVAWRGAR